MRVYEIEVRLSNVDQEVHVNMSFEQHTGEKVGPKVGDRVGTKDGLTVGFNVGDKVGLSVW